MNCRIITARDLAADAVLCRFLRDHLTWPESDFHKKLDGWACGDPASRLDGHIALVEDHGEVIGWARTETWFEGNDWPWPTLEAFVAREHRGFGVASFAAAGLACGPLRDESNVAVFRPAMLLIARRADLYATLFAANDDGVWERAS